MANARVQACELKPGDLWRKRTGTYVYICVDLFAEMKNRGVAIERTGGFRWVYGVGHNGVVASVVEGTEVVRATWAEFAANVAETTAWNTRFAAGEVPGEQVQSNDTRGR